MHDSLRDVNEGSKANRIYEKLNNNPNNEDNYAFTLPCSDSHLDYKPE